MGQINKNAVWMFFITIASSIGAFGILSSVHSWPWSSLVLSKYFPTWGVLFFIFGGGFCFFFLFLMILFCLLGGSIPSQCVD